MRDRRTLLLGIVLVAVIVRLAGIGDRLSQDEGFSWLVASAPDWATFLDRLAAYENTPPLYYVALSWFPLDDEHWLRMPSLLASVACVPVLYLAVRPLLGTRAALLSALGLAVAPYAINVSNFSRGFMFANLGLLIALWAVVRISVGGDRRWWWVYAGGAVIALYSEYDSVLFLAALITSLCILRPERRRDAVVYGALPLLALLPWIGELLRSIDALDETKAVPTYPSPSLRSLRDSMVPLFLGEHGTADARGWKTGQFWLITACIATAAALLHQRGKRDALGCSGSPLWPCSPCRARLAARPRHLRPALPDQPDPSRRRHPGGRRDPRPVAPGGAGGHRPAAGHGHRRVRGAPRPRARAGHGTG